MYACKAAVGFKVKLCTIFSHNLFSLRGGAIESGFMLLLLLMLLLF
jgi:hypothetical protein